MMYILDTGNSYIGDKWQKLFISQLNSYYPKTKIKIIIEKSQDFHAILNSELKKPSSNFALIQMPISAATVESAERGMFLPLNHLVPEKQRRNMVHVAYNRTRVGGNFFSIAKNISLGLFYFRQDILSKFGFNPPKTWTELEYQIDEIASKYHKPVHGLLFRGGNNIGKTFLEYLWSNGGSIFDHNGNPVIENTRAYEVLDFFKKLIYKKNYITKESVLQESWKTRNDFLSGQSIFYNDNSDMLLELKHKKIYTAGNNVLFTFTPIGPHGNHQLPFPEGSLYCVPANCGCIHTAKCLIDFLSDPAKSSVFYREYGYPFQRFKESIEKKGQINKITDSRISRILLENKWPAFDVLRFPVIQPSLNKNITLCLRNEIPIEKTILHLNDELFRRYSEKEFPDVVSSGLKFLRTNYAKKISLNHLSDALGLSTSYFGHIFKKSTGLSFTQYLLSYRISAAKQLLKDNPEIPAGVIGKKVGIYDYRYFYRVFKKCCGIHPDNFRKNESLNK